MLVIALVFVLFDNDMKLFNRGWTQHHTHKRRNQIMIHCTATLKILQILNKINLNVSVTEVCVVFQAKLDYIGV